MDYKSNKIDMIFKLQTRIASNLSKIPLVGYILFDEESLSTILTAKGDLDNPKISTEIAKDIATAPFNIIKRTFMLPKKVIDELIPKKQ